MNGAATPPGTRLYAIGDIHGRADLLRLLLAQIAEDAAGRPPAAQRLIYLGDYVDRGPDSLGVIDIVMDEAPPGFEVVALRGNHEEMMQRFLDDTTVARTWMMNGGDATLASYGVSPPSIFAGTPIHRHAQGLFRTQLPLRHKEFLAGLAETHVAGDYLFVHAGVRPGVPLPQQRSEDLLWIREAFLDSKANFGKVVVHGHSIEREPVVRANRIGIDTGAYTTNRLTCLVLDGTERTFLQT
jgi:serine/threonine protein phosphatase 1